MDRIFLNEMDTDALVRLYDECDSFNSIVRNYAREDALSLIGGEYMYGFCGDYSIGDTRSDFVELSEDAGGVYRWYKRVQDVCEEFSYEECEAIENYCAADIDDDVNALRYEAEYVILEHMRRLIRGYEECAVDFVNEAVEYAFDMPSGYFTEDFKHLYCYVPEHIEEV